MFYQKEWSIIFKVFQTGFWIDWIAIGWRLLVFHYETNSINIIKIVLIANNVTFVSSLNRQQGNNTYIQNLTTTIFLLICKILKCTWFDEFDCGWRCVPIFRGIRFRPRYDGPRGLLLILAQIFLRIGPCWTTWCHRGALLQLSRIVW
jgi:hypothetical protein